ncbi:MAG: LysM peptidoglycan-binding domain-containing protein [Syntrophorhabdaceae bacterium]|nr:LysM peptidoglycan-binding domain-containing protein [Syntrophorhabdaceae bacterium]
MKRRTWFGWMIAVVGIMLLLPFGAFAQEAAPEAADVGAAPEEAFLEVPPGGFVHTVVKGDTLWDLSAKHLGSPWKWKEIWELNRFLTNPHYIYPGIKIVIVPSGPREAELVVDSAKQTPSIFVDTPDGVYLNISPFRMICAGEFLREKPEGIGKIDGGKEPKEGFTTGDVVFLSLNMDIPEGQLIAAYRVRGPVNVPGGKVRAGYIKHLIGILQVSRLEDGHLTAIVRDAFEEISRTDLISDEIPGYYRIKIIPVDDDIRATVIASQSVSEALASGEYIFIDSGAIEGLEAGNVFRVHMAVELEAGMGKVERGTMMPEVARAVVVRVDPEFATLYVHSSEKPFDVGSQVRRGITLR